MFVVSCDQMDEANLESLDCEKSGIKIPNRNSSQALPPMVKECYCIIDHFYLNSKIAIGFSTSLR